MTLILEAQGLTFGYGTQPTIEQVAFGIGRGELVGVVGPNGAGKSTLLGLLLGLLRPDAGRVLIDGQPISKLTRGQIARQVAFVPQHAGMHIGFTVGQVVAMARYPYRGSLQPLGAADTASIDRALAETGTDNLVDRLVTELSGGELQRVLLARAIAQDTPIMLLDEPTANLDLEHQLQIMGLVKAYTRSGRSALMAIHDLSLAARYCDRLMILHDRRIVEDGPVDQTITEENLLKYFRVQARVDRSDPHTGPVVIPLAPIIPPGSPRIG